MNFSHVRPWPHLKVAAKTESFPSGDPRIESSPFADLRILAIRADEPPVGKLLFRDVLTNSFSISITRAPQWNSTPAPAAWLTRS